MHGEHVPSDIAALGGSIGTVRALERFVARMCQQMSVAMALSIRARKATITIWTS